MGKEAPRNGWGVIPQTHIWIQALSAWLPATFSEAVSEADRCINFIIIEVENSGTQLLALIIVYTQCHARETVS